VGGRELKRTAGGDFHSPPAVCYSMGMSERDDITQPIPTLNETYRYIVRKIGQRRGAYIGGGPLTPNYATEYGSEVADTWTGDVMSVHWAASEELASLVAETQCAERNAPTAALTFASKLALWLARGRDEEVNPGDLCEDMDRILEWHIGRLRGLVHTDLPVERLFFPAPEFNR
jgi:hypothetical protein